MEKFSRHEKYVSVSPACGVASERETITSNYDIKVHSSVIGFVYVHVALQAILQKSAIDAGLTLACTSRIPYSCSFVRSSVPGFRAKLQHCLRDFKFLRANNKIRLHARMFRRCDLIINEITDDKGLVSIPLKKQ